MNISQNEKVVIYHDSSTLFWHLDLWKIRERKKADGAGDRPYTATHSLPKLIRKTFYHEI